MGHDIRRVSNRRPEFHQPPADRRLRLDEKRGISSSANEFVCDRPDPQADGFGPCHRPGASTGHHVTCHVPHPRSAFTTSTRPTRGQVNIYLWSLPLGEQPSPILSQLPKISQSADPENARRYHSVSLCNHPSSSPPHWSVSRLDEPLVRPKSPKIYLVEIEIQGVTARYLPGITPVHLRLAAQAAPVWRTRVDA